MLLHLFEMQDRNSAWTTSLCLGQQADKNCDPRTTLACLRRHSSNPSHCDDMTLTTTTYSRKHRDLDAAYNELSLTDRHSNCAFHQLRPHTPAVCTAKIKLNRLPSVCQSELVALAPSGSQTTRSEPATRSNSIDCEDMLKLSTINKVNHDVESSRLSDLIVPNGK